MVPRGLLAMGGSPLLVLLLASGPRSPMTEVQAYLVIGASGSDQTCNWSYAVCSPLPCNQSEIVSYCGGSGPTGSATSEDWAAAIADEINTNGALSDYDATVLLMNSSIVEITGPDEFYFFVGPCGTSCTGADPEDMDLVSTGEVALGGGGGATIKRLPSSSGPAVPLAGALLAIILMGALGALLLRRSRTVSATG